MPLTVTLVNKENQQKINTITIQSGVLPPVGCEIETSQIRHSIFEKWILLVVGIKLNHCDTDNSDGYGNWGEANSNYQVLVEVVSYTTNKPKPTPVVTPTKNVRKRTKNTSTN